MTLNAKQIWQTALERLQAKVSPAIYTTWFQGTSAISFQDGVFAVSVPTTFAQSHLANRFIEPIRSVVSEITGQPVEMQFVVAKEDTPSPAPLLEAGMLPPPAPRRTYRLPRGRPSASQRVSRIADAAAAAAMTSMAPILPHANVHRITDQQERKTDEYAAYTHSNGQVQGSQVPLTPTYNSLAPTFPAQGLLNPRYTFDSFIVGKSNRLAHAASLAVAESPGNIYNPLFLYGGVGLGKTHLLHAVGHMGEEAGLTVLYVTSEKFTNEIINAIRFQKTEEFRAKYRQIDILLVDDIQFIAGKESTEEEFFHTFNSLHNANKQIVVTSDRPPKAISSLQDRLRSRFEWGLLADVQPPEYEHRLAILRSKADSLHFTIPSAVIDFIARPEASNVRELEGSLNRVIAYATLNDAPITVALAAQALEHVYSDKKPKSNLTISQILQGVCRYYSVEADLIRGKQRSHDVVWPRQVAMYLMREETTASLLQIGTELGGRDHTTIMHGWEKVHSEITNNERIRHEIAAVLESLQQ
jgi:chromosomal replication initiator protein